MNSNNHPTISSPKPYGPVPSNRQLIWHKKEFYCFIHFTVNTFTDKEWGYGDESPHIFNPTSFDANQIVGTVARSGMKALILTCKHHDGFCLWPSKYTEHSVKNSPWRDGKGDIVREISDTCREYGIDFGIYLSPWDRNHPEYGEEAYIHYFRNQLEELTTQYGEIFEVWFDGANGGDGYYGGAKEVRSIDKRTYYDWENTYKIIRCNQPNAVIFGSGGPDVRWVGNEKGIAGNPCWVTLKKKLLAPVIEEENFKTQLNNDMVNAWDSPRDLMNKGDRHGDSWVPAECDVSIRPGWFYHRLEDDKVRDAENLIDLYLKSIGRGGSLLLNLPPNLQGLISEKDVQALINFKNRLNQIFISNLAQGARCIASNIRGESYQFTPANVIDGNPETYWATDDDVHIPQIVLELHQPITFNIISLREFLPLGQRIDRFAIEFYKDGKWKEWACEYAIGPRRIIRGAECTTNSVRLRIVESPVCVAISEWGLFYDKNFVYPK